MKKYFLFIPLIAVFISCKQTNNKPGPVTSLYDSSYMPAVFTDTGRVEKIKTAFEVIDSLYKKYAADNHFPAISFGVVVDGQLLYKNSYGFTNIEKKIPATFTHAGNAKQ